MRDPDSGVLDSKYHIAITRFTDEEWRPSLVEGPRPTPPPPPIRLRLLKQQRLALHIEEMAQRAMTCPQPAAGHCGPDGAQLQCPPTVLSRLFAGLYDVN